MAKNSAYQKPPLRKILILSIIIIAVLISYNYFFVTPSLTKLLINATESDAVRITNHLASSMLISEKTEIGKDSFNIQLLRTEAEKIKRDFKFLKFKIFSPLGEIVFSTDQSEVGEINREGYFRDIVAKGEVYAKVVPKDQETLEGKKVTSDVLETYVPLMDDGRFLGVFEIYFDIANRKKQLDKLTSQSSVIILVFASGLLIAIIFILYQENIAVKKRRQLEEERLQTERLQGVIEMAGAACHELNQPLQTLFGYFHLLLNHLPENSLLFGKTEEIRKSIDQLGKITHKIMHVTRYETKEYINGHKIIDIDKASSLKTTREECPRKEVRSSGELR